MALFAFNTHKAVKMLTKAGADEALAEAMVTTFGEVLGEDIATKDDLKHLEQRLGARMDGMEQNMINMEQRMMQNMVNIEQRMTIRLGGMIALGIGVLAVVDTL